MNTWQAERVAMMHRRELESESRLRRLSRRDRVERGDGRRRTVRYRLGALLLAAGTRLTAVDRGCRVQPARPRVP